MPKIIVKCPVCLSGLLRNESVFFCLKCKQKYILKLVLKPTYKPTGYIEPKDDEPYP